MQEFPGCQATRPVRFQFGFTPLLAKSEDPRILESSIGLRSLRVKVDGLLLGVMGQ